MIQSHEELDVYQMAFKTAMRILRLRSVQVFELTKRFPQRRDVLVDRSDSPLFALCLLQHCRGVAQAAV